MTNIGFRVAIVVVVIFSALGSKIGDKNNFVAFGAEKNH